MAYEQRKGKKYYYGKVREGNKVRSVYLGSGLAATVCKQEADGRKLIARWRKDAKEYGYKIDPELLKWAQAVFGTNYRDSSAYRRIQREDGVK